MENLWEQKWRSFRKTEPQSGPEYSRTIHNKPILRRENDRRDQKGRNYLEVEGKRFVFIYRAVDADHWTFNPMDYVTLSKKFAKEHAEHEAAVDDQDQHVIYLMVKGEHVFEAPNAGEWFYDGPPVKAKQYGRMIRTLNEVEPFQKEMRRKHPKWKKATIGLGGNKSDGGGPFTEKPSMERSKSAPPMEE